MDYDALRYQNLQKRQFCQKLMANPKAKNHPRAISVVAKMMAQVRISEAELSHKAKFATAA